MTEGLAMTAVPCHFGLADRSRRADGLSGSPGWMRPAGPWDRLFAAQNGELPLRHLERLVRTLGRSTLRPAAALLLTVSLVGIGPRRERADAGNRSAADGDGLKARIDRRVQEWQPTKEERRLDDIGWARDLREALRLAQQYRRPIFLFTYSGSSEREHAMALQRC